MPVKKEKILVIVPTVDRWVTDSIAVFFAKCIEKTYDPVYPYEVIPSTLAKVRGYAYMRNMGASRFLQSPFDRLWFIDADTILPDGIFDLPKIDGDVVTMPYPFVGTMCPAICNYKDINDFSKGMEEIEMGDDGVADVNGTGMGCTLIRRSLLEDERMRYSSDYTTADGHDATLDESEPPPIFRYHMKPNGCTMLGEDFDFCIRARRLGYSVKINLKSSCDHLKQVELNKAWMTVEEQLSGARKDTRIYDIA